VEHHDESSETLMTPEGPIEAHGIPWKAVEGCGTGKESS
jgi:hypothetical protein